MRELGKLLSIRAWLTCGFLAVGAGVAAAQLEPSLQTPVAIVAMVLLMGGYVFLMPGTAATCPFCFKRVKFGASRCHHCGQYVGR